MLTRNEQFYDNLALYAAALQMIDVFLLLGEASNNDIMEALQQQNKEYMEKVIYQNNRILRILSEKDMSTEQQYYTHGGVGTGLPFCAYKEELLWQIL